VDGPADPSPEPARCGNDAPLQFKGIFSRNLAVLNASAPVRAFFRRNAESIWKHRDAKGRFSLVWSGPAGVKTAASQIPALDALVSAEAEGAPPGKQTKDTPIRGLARP
jgi:hypothetical protein